MNVRLVIPMPARPIGEIVYDEVAHTIIVEIPWAEAEEVSTFVEGRITIDGPGFIYIDGERLVVPKSIERIIASLVTRWGRMASFDELSREAFGYPASRDHFGRVDSGQVSVAITRARKALAAYGFEIHNEWGRGYRLTLPLD